MATASPKGGVILKSARHPGRAWVTLHPNISDEWMVWLPDRTLMREVLRKADGAVSRPDSNQENMEGLQAKSEYNLREILHRAARVATTLPHQPFRDFSKAVEKELERILPTSGGNFSTEVERMVKQRVGQDRFREALLAYWKGACAVTGVDCKSVLRASHAKPWADCDSDEERLNPFNGLLLTANLDALFDGGLIGFDEDGSMLISPSLDPGIITKLQLGSGWRLRWIAEEHRPFLKYHLRDVFHD